MKAEYGHVIMDITNTLENGNKFVFVENDLSDHQVVIRLYEFFLEWWWYEIVDWRGEEERKQFHFLSNEWIIHRWTWQNTLFSLREMIIWLQ